MKNLSIPEKYGLIVLNGTDCDPKSVTMELMGRCLLAA